MSQHSGGQPEPPENPENPENPKNPENPEQPRTPSTDGGYEPEVEGMSRQTDLGSGVLAYLLAGPLTFGGIGWGLDWLLNTWFLLPIGLVVGMGMAMYTIWLRYGRS